MMGAACIVNSDQSAKDMHDNIDRLFAEHKYVRFAWSIGPDRTLEQNKKIHALYKDVHEQLEGWTYADVKRYCKLELGIPEVLAHDEKYRTEFADIFKAMKFLSQEQKLILMDAMPVTRRFRRNQGSEYIELIHQTFSPQGVRFSER